MAPTATHDRRFLSFLCSLVGRVVCHFPFSAVRFCDVRQTAWAAFCCSATVGGGNMYTPGLICFSLDPLMISIDPSSSCGAQVRIIRAHVDSGRSFGHQAPGSLEENKSCWRIPLRVRDRFLFIAWKAATTEDWRAFHCGKRGSNCNVGWDKAISWDWLLQFSTCSTREDDGQHW